MYKILFLLLSGGLLNAQVGINSTAPSPSEALRIQSKPNNSTDKDRGLLIPRVKLDDILGSPNPVVSPKLNLMVYNPDADYAKEGFYLFNGTGWNKMTTQDDVLQKVVPTKHLIDTSTSGAVQNSDQGKAKQYNEGDDPITNGWAKIPGLEKTVTVSKSKSNVTILTEGMVQWNIAALPSGVFSQTFAVGVFIDNKLYSVRSYYIDGYSQMGCLAQIFDIKVIAENLSIGDHKIEVYAITRSQQSPVPGRQGHGTLTWGAASAPKLPGDNDPRTATCSNINTSPMAEGVMAIYIQEFY